MFVGWAVGKDVGSGVGTSLFMVGLGDGTEGSGKGRGEGAFSVGAGVGINARYVGEDAGWTDDGVNWGTVAAAVGPGLRRLQGNLRWTPSIIA